MDRKKSQRSKGISKDDWEIRIAFKDPNEKGHIFGWVTMHIEKPGALLALYVLMVAML